MLEITKQTFTKQLILDLPTQAITPGFVDFFDKNIKKNPGKTSIKFNISESKDMKLGLYTLEKGVLMNDELIDFIQENVDVEISVVPI